MLVDGVMPTAARYDQATPFSDTRTVAAGTNTSYVNVQMGIGASSGDFAFYPAVDAVFYPD